MHAFRALAWPEYKKKREVKINYFVVDAGRGIDRTLDRIKSRAARLPFSRFPFTRVTLIPTHRSCSFPAVDGCKTTKMITSRGNNRWMRSLLSEIRAPRMFSDLSRRLERVFLRTHSHESRVKAEWDFYGSRRSFAEVTFMINFIASGNYFLIHYSLVVHSIEY